jgi:hypothetical protein
MLTTRRILLALSAVCLSLVVFASAALAGEPATVTVRVQGLDGETLLPQTQVTTSTTPIPVESGSCSGTSAGGALYDATHGNWKVKYAGEGVEIDGIEGLNFPSFAENPGIYWAFWLNDKYAENGACKEEVSSGADIVFFAQCYEMGTYCPSNPTAPEHFLTMTAPKSSVVNLGETVAVTVASLSTESGASEPSLPAGVTVTGGSSSATPGAGGVTTVSFSAAGTYTIQAQAADSVGSDQYTICVHNGNDGNCGTTAASTTTTGTTATSPAPAVVSAPYKGPYALVAHATGVIDGHVYAPGKAPRVLAGTVAAHSAISAVSLELRRSYKGRCYAYDGTSTRFVRARCGHGSSFKVSSDRSFSYLLPAALAPGRYVLDIQATDVAGNHSTLARGSSRIVFYVR